jgi:hypothetical protein
MARFWRFVGVEKDVACMERDVARTWEVLWIPVKAGR